MFFDTYLHLISPYSGEEDDDDMTLFNNEQTRMNYIVYGCIVPFISGFGIMANFINGIVLTRPKMTPSAFTYLAALSWFDCASCTIIFVTSLTRSMFSDNNIWLQCDVQLQTPIFGFTTGSANLILVFVTLDRLIFLKKGLPNSSPSFCTKRVARIIIVCLCTISAILNVPYFFIFVKKDGKFYSTQFFHSSYYIVHNWINFIIVAIFPAVFLMIGNSIMVSIIRKWANSACPLKSGVKCRSKSRYYYQIKLTSSLVAMICLFYIGDIPAHLVSHKSAVSLLFNGDLTKNESAVIDTVRMVVAILNSFQLSVNIVVYAVLNPVFVMELFGLVRCIMVTIKTWMGIDAALKYLTMSRVHELMNFLKTFTRIDSSIVNRKTETV